VFGTLVIQGLTLRPLMLALNFKDDGSVKREVDYAMRATAEAAIKALENEPSSEETDVVRREYQARLNSDGTERPTVSSKSLLAQVESRAIAAERAALLNLRARGEIGDDAFHVVEERLDWAEVCANRK
jgi:monovalent cation/hydrogen antiporter